MNSSLADRKDSIRTDAFEQMVAIQNAIEEPDAPPVRVIPHPEEAAPEFTFVYTNRVIYEPGVDTIQSLGCACKDECAASEACMCYQRQSDENARYGRGPGFAYDLNGLLQFRHDEKMAIWECNDMCGCPPSCRNRVIGKGRKVPVDLYRTDNCGWGAKLGKIERSDPTKRGKIKAGTFVGVYCGEQISKLESRRRVQ